MDDKPYAALLAKLHAELTDRIKRNRRNLAAQADAYLTGKVDLSAFLRDAAILQDQIRRDEQDLESAGALATAHPKSWSSGHDSNEAMPGGIYQALATLWAPAPAPKGKRAPATPAPAPAPAKTEAKTDTEAKTEDAPETPA